MAQTQTGVQQNILDILKRANQIASKTSLDELLDQMLDLILEVSGANAGTLYLLDRETNDLIFKVVKGSEESKNLIGRRFSIEHGIAGATVRELNPILVDDITRDPRWNKEMAQLAKSNIQSALSIPLLLDNAPIGVVQIFNFSNIQLELIQILGNRMASEIDKAILLEASRTRSKRLEALVEIIGNIASTLDRDRILQLIVAYARQLLDVEASVLFLMDSDKKELYPYISSPPEIIDSSIRLKADRGIVGQGLEYGQTIIFQDTTSNEVISKYLDSILEIENRSMVAVPLRAQKILLGQDRGETEPTVIGGLITLNKIEGQFTKDDILLLETLARQAATVRQIAQSYADTNELFFDVIRALTAAIDAKDPYTRGHSQRVSEFSVSIARQLRLGDEMIHHIRIGAILHDVGKIGVPDDVLQKPGRLTNQEFERIKEHPTIGKKIMGNIRMLQDEMPALTEHHERLDGSGYPNGLQDERISLLGRIVAVADVFDALTSDRTYRNALNVPEAFHILNEGMGTHFEPLCVQALIRAYNNGEIKTQKEIQETTASS